MRVKQFLRGLGRGLAWWFSIGLITGPGRVLSEWSKAGITPPWYLLIALLFGAGLGVYGLVVLWRTRRSFREELAWLATGVITWIGAVILGLLVMAALFGRAKGPPSATPSQITPSTPPIAQPISLRQLDWKRVLAEDPDIKVLPEDECGGGLTSYQCIKIKDKLSAGYAVTEDILFGDLSGDNQDEAVIMVHSGGSAGNDGLLVYKLEGGKPTLMDVLGGYNLSAQFDKDGKFSVREPVSAGYEPNCCPGGEKITHYGLQENKLAVISRVERGRDEARSYAVKHFYSLLNEREYDKAYNLLSHTFRTSHPYDAWVEDFSPLHSIEAKVKESGKAEPIGVGLILTEKSDGHVVTRRLVGTWILIYSLEAHQWLLDKDKISEVK